MANAVEVILDTLASLSASRSESVCKILVPFPPEDDATVKLARQTLLSLSSSDLQSLIDARFPPNHGSIPAFREFVSAYMRLLSSTSSHSPPSFDLAFPCFSSCVNVFQQSEGSWFLPTLKIWAHAITSLCLNEHIVDDHEDRVGKATNALNKALSLSVVNAARHPVTYTMTNHLMRIFFAINNFRLIDRVRAMAARASPSVEQISCKADQVTHKYFVGRLNLNRRLLNSARRELLWAFDNCSERYWKNKRTILIYLVAASLPLGIYPCSELLSHFQLDSIYGPLLIPLQQGNYKQVRKSLDDWRSWYLAKGIYLLLREKLELICWRNLARFVTFISPKDAQMALEDLLAAAQIAMVDDDTPFDIDDIESICVSLLDQGYIKAYILHSRNLLVLQRGENRGFPPIPSVKLATQED